MKKKSALTRSRLGRLGGLFAFVWLSAGLSAQPIDNPIADYYSGNDGYPAWSDEVQWDRVIDMSTYSNGSDNFEKFENARDELFSQGGGVLYYPSGTYSFDVPTGPNGRGLLLKSGVVIRGQKPTSSTNAVVNYDNHGLNSMPTVFDFGSNDAMKFIGSTPADADRVGIAWVRVQHGYVFFGFNASRWASTWSQGDSWLSGREVGNWPTRIPDGTFAMDTWVGDGTSGKWDSGDAIYGSKRFVFGCRFDDAYIRNDIINKGNCNGFSEDEESWRFGGVLSVYGSDIFVANNVMSKNSGTKRNRLCLDVNKQLLALYRNRCDAQNNQGGYAENVVVRDNWFYNRGNKTYEVSGKWMVLRDNIANKDYLSGTPFFNTCEGGTRTSDYMNRAFDVGGMNAWVHNNEYHDTGSGGNDGEGILGQRHNEVEIFSHAWTDNFGGPASQEDGRRKGYIAPYDMEVYGFLLFRNRTERDAGIGIHKPDFSKFSDLAIVSNNPGGNLDIAGLTDLISSCPSGSPSSPSNVSITENGDGSVRIDWTDTASNEIGFRVERRINGGSVTTIAYRPRHSAGSDDFTYDPSGGAGGGPCDCTHAAGFDFNPQSWVDYLAPTGASLSYRVVAINCGDNDAGASAWQQIGSSNIVPTAVISADPTSGTAPVTVDFDGSGSSDSDGSIVSYEWDFEDDGVWDATGVNASHLYSFGGEFTVRLRVTDNEGGANTTVTTLDIGADPTNEPPLVEAGGDALIGLGAQVQLEGSASDPEGAPVSLLWTKQSGPGTVTFEDDTAASTIASFSSAGTYVLQLSASDGQLSAGDTTTVVVSTSVGGNFQESEGLLVFEVESAPLADGWNEETSFDDFKGSSYYIATKNSFTSPGKGILEYSFDVTNGGPYQLQWRSRIGAGTESTEHNDNFARMVDSSGNVVTPLNSGNLDPTGNWYKIYMNVFGSWSWNAGNNDSNPRAVAWDLQAGETYTFQVSYRSQGHAIDRIMLWNRNMQDYGNTSSGVADNIEAADGLLQSSRIISGNQPPAVDAGADQSLQNEVTIASIDATVVDDGNPSGILTLSWTQVDGPATSSIDNPEAEDITVTLPVEGVYTFRLSASDGALSDWDEITVTRRPYSPVVYAINCGGDAYTAIDGTEFEADNYHLTGDEYSTSIAIAGTEDDELFHSERFIKAPGTVDYEFPIADGDYKLTLMWSENTGSGRLMDVSVEGVLVIDALDVASLAGGDKTAYLQTLDVAVSDGALNLSVGKDASATENYPNIMAILIEVGDEPLPVRVDDVVMSENDLSIMFKASASGFFMLETRSDLSSGDWATVDGAIQEASSEGDPITLAAPRSGDKGFYRVVYSSSNPN